MSVVLATVSKCKMSETEKKVDRQKNDNVERVAEAQRGPTTHHV